MRFSLLSQLACEPWYISETLHAELLADMLQAASAIAPAGSDSEGLTRTLALAFAQRPAATMEKETGLAHIHVFGPVARNLPPIERAMGKTDFAQLHEDFATACAAGARGVLLHMDTPGGTVNGTPEGAKLIADCPIPVVVHAKRAASAGYYIAAGADRIIASPSAEVGSIGVMMPRVDLSEALARVGIKMDTITNTAGDLKGIGQGALTPVQREHLKAEADGMFNAFRDHILNHRTVPAAAMRGQTMTGSAALAANLIDAVGDAGAARAHLLTLISAGTNKLAA